MFAGLHDRLSVLSRPADGMTWTQVAGIVVFVLVVLFAWRQVTRFIVEG